MTDDDEQTKENNDRRAKQMSGKKISKERALQYRELIKLMKQQEKRGEDKNISQASRQLKKKYGWTEQQRTNFVRAFLKAGGEFMVL
jgi:hypothetical protein